MPSGHLILWRPVLLPQSFPVSGTFPMSCLFASGDQNTLASASASVVPVNFQGWSPLTLTAVICLLSRGLSLVFSSPTVRRHQFFGILCSLPFSSQNHWEDHRLNYTDLCRQSNVSAFNTLSRFVIDFLPRSNCPMISWLQSLCAAILEPKKRKTVTTSTFPLLFAMQYGARCHYLSFFFFSLKPALSLSSFTLIKRLFSSSLSAIGVVSSLYLMLLMFLPPILIPDCNSSSPAFLMMCSACWLNKQGDSPVVLLSPSWTNQLFHTGF